MNFVKVLAATVYASGCLFTALGAATDWKQSYAFEATGKYAEALAALDEVSKEEKAGYLYSLRHGWLYYLSGLYSESVTSYKKACDVSPKAVEPRIGGLLPLMADKRWTEAEKWAKAALAIEPDNYLARRRLALTLYNLGRFEEAEAQYRKVIVRYPGDLEMLAGSGWCLLRLNKNEEAKKAFQAVLAVKPDDAAAQSGLAALR